MALNRTLLNLDLRFTDCGDEAIFAISQIIYFNQQAKMYEGETDKEIKEASPYIISDLRRAILNEYTEDTPVVSVRTDNVTIPDFISRSLSTEK